MTEHEIQKEIVSIINKRTPYLAIKLNNEGKRTAKGTQYLKSEGLLSGAADLIILTGNNLIEFWEIKTPKGKQSPRQIEFQEDVELRGYTYRLIRSPQQAVEIIEQLLTTTKRTRSNVQKTVF